MQAKSGFLSILGNKVYLENRHAQSFINGLWLPCPTMTGFNSWGKTIWPAILMYLLSGVFQERN